MANWTKTVCPQSENDALDPGWWACSSGKGTHQLKRRPTQKPVEMPHTKPFALSGHHQPPAKHSSVSSCWKLHCLSGLHRCCGHSAISFKGLNRLPKKLNQPKLRLESKVWRSHIPGFDIFNRGATLKAKSLFRHALCRLSSRRLPSFWGLICWRQARRCPAHGPRAPETSPWSNEHKTIFTNFGMDPPKKMCHAKKYAIWNKSQNRRCRQYTASCHTPQRAHAPCRLQGFH